MAFRTEPSLSRVYEQVKRTAENTRATCVNFRDRTLAGDVPIDEIVNDLLGALVNAVDRFSSLPAGIVAYAQEQENDAQYNVATEGNAMISAVTGARDWIITNLPKDGNDYLLERQLDASGNKVRRVVTTVQTAGLRTQLQAVIDAITA